MKKSMLASALTMTISINAVSATNHETKTISDSLSIFTFNNINTVVSHGQDGLVIIDSGHAHNEKTQEKTLESLAGKNTPKYIISTHWHQDQSLPPDHGHGAVLVAHPDSRESFLKNLSKNPNNTAQKPAGISFDKELILHFNNEKIRIVNFRNGHTKNDAVVFFEDNNTVYTGELFRSYRFPVVDLENGGHPVSLYLNLLRLKDMIDTSMKIIPAKGAAADREAFTDYMEMIMATISEVQAMKNKGLSLDEIKQQGLNEKWLVYGRGEITEQQWIETIYKALK